MAPHFKDGSVDSSTKTRFAEPRLSPNALKVLQARYLKKDESGECVEQPTALYERVATTIAGAERLYGANDADVEQWTHAFYDLMARGDFMPNSPTLMNAGREMGMLSACFVLPVPDSIVGIFDSIKHTAMIQKAGGGTGFAFDELRPTGDFIKSSGGTTSGPITFWRAFSEATNAIQQGAFRRGANMGMMYIHHPDILKFLHAKQDLNQFNNYNISVKVTDAWMNELRENPDSPHVVRNPRNGRAFIIPRTLDIWKYDIQDLVEVDWVEPVPARDRAAYFTTPRIAGDVPADLQGEFYTKHEIWEIILKNAWQTGEPGVVFMDRINEENPTPHVGRIEATNPCGEQPLLPFEACNLGSINLGNFVRNGCTPEAEVDWEALRKAVHLSTRFLDNVIDANNYPLPEIDAICKANRKIGLGVMGFADVLFKLNVPYNSEQGVKWGERFMRFINDEAHNHSEELARQRGCFPNWEGSIWHTRHDRLMRNAATTTIAPTGTISIIADCSGGIEPMFSLAFIRNVLRGQKHGDKPLVEVNGTFRQIAEERGFVREELFAELAEKGTLHGIENVPDDVRQVFVCAHDITPDWHARMQAAFQKHCDASISKTINFPESATVEDVEQIYRLAFELGCKGVTVYRNNCRSFQPMSLTKKETESAGAASAPAPAEAATKEVAQPIEMSSSIEPLRPRPLPEISSALRIRQLTPFGNMHVQITVDAREGRETEVFAQLGKGGDVANSDLEAICRLTSLWLRSGGEMQLVVKQLAGIGSSLQIPTRTGRIMSLGDGLATALKKYQRAKERFGLESLLLGQVDFAALDRPDAGAYSPGGADTRTPPAPAETPETPKPRRRRRSSKRAGVAAANGKNGDSGEGPTVKLLWDIDGRSAREPKATAVARVAAEPGGADFVVIEQGTATVVAEPPAIARPRTSPAQGQNGNGHAVADRSNGVAAAPAPAPQRSSRDFAAHYKIKCPECGGPLAIQEGCRKCHACGWAAC